VTKNQQRALKDAQRDMQSASRQERYLKRRQIVERIQQSLADLTCYLDDLHVLGKTVPTEEEFTAVRKENNRLKQELEKVKTEAANREQADEHDAEEREALYSKQTAQKESLFSKEIAQLKREVATLNQLKKLLEQKLAEKGDHRISDSDAAYRDRITAEVAGLVHQLKDGRMKYELLKEESLRKVQSMEAQLTRLQQECDHWKAEAGENVNLQAVKDAQKKARRAEARVSYEIKETKRQYNDIHARWSELYQLRAVASPPPPHYLTDFIENK
jgi:hypothetical protein